MRVRPRYTSIQRRKGERESDRGFEGQLGGKSEERNVWSRKVFKYFFTRWFGFAVDNEQVVNSVVKAAVVSQWPLPFVPDNEASPSPSRSPTF